MRLAAMALRGAEAAGKTRGVDDLVLASASPRRAALLRSAGLTIRVQPVECEEVPRPHEPAVAYARRLAAAKLAAALETGAGISLPVLAADTVVWQATTAAPLGKPRDRRHARSMLRTFSGSDHFVTTAWVLARPGAAPRVKHETTRVWMRPMDDATVDAYLDTEEWCDKAGGYGIQGNAAGLVLRIEGSYTNVVGLPLAQVLRALKPKPGGER